MGRKTRVLSIPGRPRLVSRPLTGAAQGYAQQHHIMRNVVMIAYRVPNRADFRSTERFHRLESILLDVAHELPLDRFQFGVPRDVDELAQQSGAEPSLPVFRIDYDTHLGVVAARIATMPNEDTIGANALAIERQQRKRP